MVRDAETILCPDPECSWQIHLRQLPSICFFLSELLSCNSSSLDSASQSLTQVCSCSQMFYLLFHPNLHVVISPELSIRSSAVFHSHIFHHKSQKLTRNKNCDWIISQDLSWLRTYLSFFSGMLKWNDLYHCSLVWVQQEQVNSSAISTFSQLCNSTTSAWLLHICASYEYVSNIEP